MVSSNTTAGVTTSAAAVTVLTSTQLVRRITIINEGAVAGFFSIDNWGSSPRLPAASSPTSPIVITIETEENPCNVQVKNGTGGNLSGIYAWAV